MITTSLNFNLPSLDFSDKNILIIDDYQEMRAVFRDILRNCEADVKKIYMASNGSEAIAHLKKEQFDIVLCDFNLGQGKNGQQVLEEAKCRSLVGPSCLWIMITAEKTFEIVTSSAEYQPDAYLLKPVTEASLRLRLAKVWKRKKAFLKIYRAMDQLNYTKALSLCDEQLASDKGNEANLLRTKCDLLLMMGEYGQAQELLNDILAEKSLPWTKTALAKVMLKKNDFATAKILLTETIGENPTFIEAHDLLAQTLQTMGEFEEAHEALKRAILLSPHSVLRQKNLGLVAMKIGDLENASQAFRKSISLGENSVLKSVDAYIGLAKVCGIDQKTNEAIKVLEQLNKGFATEDVRLKALAVEGLIYHQNGNGEKAKKIAAELSQVLTEKGTQLNSSGSLDMARLLMTTGDTEKAMSLLKQEIRNSPENVMLLQDVSEIFKEGGMGEEGNKLIETLSEEAITTMNRGVLLVSKGKYDEAINAMREAQAVMPSNVRVLLNMAHVIITYMQNKGPTPELIKEARDNLFAANELSPGEPRYIRLMAALNEISSSA